MSEPPSSSVTQSPPLSSPMEANASSSSTAPPPPNTSSSSTAPPPPNTSSSSTAPPPPPPPPPPPDTSSSSSTAPPPQDPSSSSTAPPPEDPPGAQMEATIKKHRYSNFAYLNRSTIEKLVLTLQVLKKRRFEPNLCAYVIEINTKLVLLCREDETYLDNEVAINYLHADFLNLVLRDTVYLTPFIIPPNFKLKALGLEVEDTGGKLIEDSYADIAREFRKQLKGQIFCTKQLLYFDYSSVKMHMRVSFVAPQDGDVNRGILGRKTEIHFFESDVFKVHGKKEIERVFRRDFNILEVVDEMKSLGIGAVGNTIKDVFYHLVIPRFLPEDIAREIRYKHKQGLIIEGPPGTGKTSIARAISKILNGKLQVVKGPEVFDSLFGQSESTIRELFTPAIQDLKEKGIQSPLHVIVFDELDSIAQERGTNHGSTKTDTILNQLLTMIDGYSGLSNILLIGTTNRIELIDKALLRPERFGLHLKIGLPDLGGRLEILKIYARKMQRNGTIGGDFDFLPIAELTEEFSGADLEDLVHSTYSRAMIRYCDSDIAKTKWDDITIEMQDFVDSIDEHKSKRASVEQSQA